MNINYRVSRDYSKYSDTGLDGFAVTVVNGLNTSGGFPALPVPANELETINENFRESIAAATGAPEKTVAKNNARVLLEDALRKDANYVETIAGQNLELLLSSGFLAVNTNRAQAPLVTPDIMQLDNLGAGQFLLRLKPVTNAKSYQVQISNNGGTAWAEAGIYTQARRVTLGSLTAGTTYTLRARAVGGATGYSDWSPTQSRMAT